MEIKGEVTDIIYQNEVNSYTIVVFDTDEEETAIVGYLPFIKKLLFTIILLVIMFFI